MIFASISFFNYYKVFFTEFFIYSTHTRMTSKKNTFVVCSNYAWTIYNFRMPLIKRLKREGYIVIVVTQFDGYEKIIEKDVDKIIPLFISRKGINPFIDFLTLCHFLKHFFVEKPDFVLLFTIKPVIYGSIAARLMNIKSIVTITGLGTAFIKENWLTNFVKKLYRFSLLRASKVFFQNAADKSFFISDRLVDPSQCLISPGSGVDTNKFFRTDLPVQKEMTFLLVARMLWDKGIGEFIEAARIIKPLYPQSRFQLLGPQGVENRTAIPISKIAEWQEEGVAEYLGETNDVTYYIQKACCVVLPSYREGISRVLLEAAAMGRPLIATDVPGCREVIEDGVTGFLCKSRDYISLAQKIEAMLKMSFKARLNMGIKGRDKIVNEFNESKVTNLYINTIDLILS